MMITSKFSQVLFRSSKRSFSIMPSKSEEHDLPQAKLFPPRHDTMLPKGSYDNRTVLITGGGTGLGKGMALKFSELGANVAIASRRLPILEETASEIQNITGNKVLPLQCDARDPEAIKNAVDKCVQELGLPNVVISNAATICPVVLLPYLVVVLLHLWEEAFG